MWLALTAFGFSGAVVVALNQLPSAADVVVRRAERRSPASARQRIRELAEWYCQMAGCRWEGTDARSLTDAERRRLTVQAQETLTRRAQAYTGSP